MTIKIIISGLLLLKMAASVYAAAKPSVYARVDQNVIAPGESLQLMVTVQEGQGEVDISPISEFNVFSRGTSTSMQIINGRTTQETTYNYLLVPKNQGTLTIPALVVTVDGRTHHTEPITVTVTQQPQTSTGKQPRQVWVEAELSRLEPYISQYTVYTFRLYNTVQVTDAKFQPPAFNGFSAKELEKRNTYAKIINGRQHQVTEVFFVLMPLSPGKQTIEPSVVELGIVQPDNRRSPFGFDSIFDDPIFRRKKIEPKVLQTKPLTAQVKPLPPYEKAVPFSGLVGQFKLQAGVEQTELNAGDSTTLTITIQGQGNIMDAQAPDIQIPENFKIYADAPEEEINLNKNGYTGKKIFRTALVPVQAGTYTLPPVQLTYFDVDQGKYITLSHQLQPLQVEATTQATAAPDIAALAPTTSLKKRVEFTGRDILPPKQSLDAVQHQQILSWIEFALWILLPALGFLNLIFVQRLVRKDSSPAAVMAAKAHRALKIARTAGDDEALFLSQLFQAVTAAILTAAGRTGQALTWKEARQILEQSGQTQDTAQQAATLLETIESIKFSNTMFSVDQRNALLQQAHELVRKLTA